MKRALLLVSALLLSGIPILLAANPDASAIPDLTRGGTIDHTLRWTLGPTGARGWFYSNRHSTEDSRQIYVTEVQKGSPADGLLVEGDVILGVEGSRKHPVSRFSSDARKALSTAITEAEKDANAGELKVIRWRKGKEKTVTLPLKVMGSFSETAPYDCAKTERIIDMTVASILETGLDNGMTNLIDGAGIPGVFNALGLMATGRPEVMPLVKAKMQQLAVEPVDGMKWGHAWSLVALTEYYLQSGDESVLAAITRYSLETAQGQSVAGTWGHGFAAADGVLAGYGAMNQVSIPHTIGLILARKCGVEDAAIQQAIDRSVRFFSYYTGKGSVPYGAHEAGDTFGPDDNGKSSGVAIICNLLSDKEGSRFFARHGVYDYSRIEVGHASNFFHLPWQGMASAQLGVEAAAAHLRECRWYYELQRDWRGRFRHHEAPGSHDPNKPWDASGARLLFWCLPRKQLYLTGKGGYAADALSKKEVAAIVESGRHDGEYDTLSIDQLVSRLGDWCHATRYRAAEELSTREGDWCSLGFKMHAGNTMDQKYGALRIFEALKEKAAPAVDLLIKDLSDPDLWLRIRSVYALRAIGEPAGKAVPALIEAVSFEDPDDYRHMYRRVIAVTLFDKKSGLLRDKGALAAVPRDQLIPALKILLRGEEGQSVTCLANPLKMLTFEELQPLWPEIVYRVEHRLSENVMFAHMQSACFDLLADHNVEEGLRMVGYKMSLQNEWGGERRNDDTLNALRKYGVHAKRAYYPLQAYLQKNVAFNPKLQAFKKDIEATTAKPVLRTIAPWLGDYEIGSHFEMLTTMGELRKKIASQDLAEYWKVYDMCRELLDVKPEWAVSTQAVIDELLGIPKGADIVAAHLALEQIKQDLEANKISPEQAIEQLTDYSDKYDIATRGPNLVYWYSLMWSDRLKSGKDLK